MTAIVQRRTQQQTDLYWRSILETRVLVDCHVDKWEAQQEGHDPYGDDNLEHPAEGARVLSFQRFADGVVPAENRIRFRHVLCLLKFHHKKPKKYVLSQGSVLHELSVELGSKVDNDPRIWYRLDHETPFIQQ